MVGHSAGEAPRSSAATSPTGAHRTPAPLTSTTPTPSPPTGPARCRTPPPQPPPRPLRGRGRHRFPRSHGPAEYKVKTHWLTLRCPTNPEPSSARRINSGPCATSEVKMPKEPKSRRILGDHTTQIACGARRPPGRVPARGRSKCRTNPRAAGFLEKLGARRGRRPRPGGPHANFANRSVADLRGPAGDERCGYFSWVSRLASRARRHRPSGSLRRIVSV
jgi:hypothetical protein